MFSDNNSESDRFARLRREAIDLLDRKPDFATPSGASLRELIHELSVHQTELILQNEELKLSQNELEKISHEYENLYEQAPCGYITLTSKGIISRINSTALTLLEGHRITPYVSRFGAFIEPGWDDLYYAAIENSGKTGERQNLDLKLKTRQDKTIWVQAQIDADRNDQDQVHQWKLVFMDISHKIIVENALEQSRQRFKTLFHNAPIAYQSLDEDGRFLEVNDSWLATLGYERKEVIGTPFSQFLNSDMQAHFKENFPRFKAVGEVLGVQFEMIKKDGSPIIVSFHGKIGKNARGEFEQTHCVLTDITAQKKAEQTAKQFELKLQQNNKLEAIGVLAGGIAHDFNNILQPIMGFSELTLNELPTDSPLCEHVEEILRGSQRAAQLVRRILNFSSQNPKPPEPLLVQGIFKEAIQFLRSSIPSSIELYQEISPDPIYILHDPIQLYEITMNLCTNAYHAMEDKGGLLSFVVKEVDIIPDQDSRFEKKADRYCKISVTDSGVGIAPHDIEKIFDPYFTTKEIGKGSGLGLSVVHGIVKHHQGEIVVKSRPGRTQVDVYFPVVDPLAEMEPKKMAHGRPVGNERVLFVDDEHSIVKLVERSLDKLGYKTTGMTSSTEALERFKRSPDQFDIIISDLTMPQMTGAAFITKIRQIRPDIPVIICTGGDGMISDEKILSLGISDFFSKPISIDDLSRKIRRALDHSAKGE